MTGTAAQPQQDRVKIPAIPAVYANTRKAYILSVDGEVSELSHIAAKKIIAGQPILVCHAPHTLGRLDLGDVAAFDVLELFAFVHPARFAVPTPAGIAKSLGLTAPQGADDYPYTLMEAASALLSDLRTDQWRGRADPLKIAGVMGQNGRGWRWTPYIFAALGAAYDEKEIYVSRADLNIWKNLPEWAESAPPPPPSHYPVSKAEAREKLQSILGSHSEQRGAQMDYAGHIASMFAPRDHEDDVNAVLIEAGTGVGKTLGYLAPASLWAEKNKGSVWISTYTKNLQKQIGQELDRLYPDADVKAGKVAVRKGRENYLCLLNLEDEAAGAALAKSPRTAIAAGLMARWAAATRDGDLSGGDFPGWLSGLLGAVHTIGLADRRGECIYSACDHYHRCFVERSIRAARHADLVIANHALVMIQTASSSSESELPRHYIFDEGHHLFDAADSAYAGHLSARETYDMRRWLRGNETTRKSRARGLKRRAEDLIEGDAKLETCLRAILEASSELTGEGWSARLKDSAPKGAAEKFLFAVFNQVYARADERSREAPYSVETDSFPLSGDILPAAQALHKTLEDIIRPMGDLADGFRKKMLDGGDDMNADMRKRLDAIAAALMRRTDTLRGWASMLASLAEGKTPESFIDWMEIERHDGRAIDVGLYRHWIDPMVPFSQSLRPYAHGVAVTSATLRDASGIEEADWRVARTISGLDYMGGPVTQEKLESPFDYPAKTKVFIINDVRKEDLAQVAGACQTLFEASGGGALGLFTAIQRLRAVHGRIAPRLEESGLHLYAQHVDAIDNGTLVDIFKDDINACLLGTDAVRDGVDVPGDSLRLIVFDRVPWPRPTILHRARKEIFGGRIYDDRIARLKLKQAFGRLIRRTDDRGVFVMLDSMLPSRLYGAFPDGVAIEKTGLADAARQIREFLK
ncbi:MAG: ATP-dependent DNA helicase [Micavibrio sp.]